MSDRLRKSAEADEVPADEDESTVDHPGNAVVKTLTLSLD